MDEEEIKNWTKAHRNEIVDRIIADTAPDKNRLAIFMAGIPGAGKTELAQRLFFDHATETNQPLRIEHDFLVEHIDGYLPESYYRYRKAGSILVTELFETSLREGYSFIFDGTLAHEKGLKNVEKCLNKGFDVLVAYVAQDPGVAWSLTQDRELVKKRSIERSGFIATTNTIHSALYGIFTTFSDHPKFAFTLFDKSNTKNIAKAEILLSITSDTEKRDIASFLKKDYTLDRNFGI